MDRKWFAHKILVVILLVAGLLAPAISAAAAGEGLTIVVADGLNLRTGPGLDHEVLRVLPRGQEVVVVDTSEDGAWFEVRLADGAKGWVYGVYIKSVSEGAIGAGGEVSSDRLNLRAGPGFEYRVLRVLELGQVLQVQGRSEDNRWLQVALTEGVGGWVFAYFIDTQAVIADLPVKEAYGGPDGSGKGARPAYSILVNIENNQADVSLAGFPAETRFSVALGVPGGEADLVVANGKTGANGGAWLSFEMPAKWSNGQTVKENTLVLTVRAVDGSFTRSINIQYYRG